LIGVSVELLHIQLHFWFFFPLCINFLLGYAPAFLGDFSHDTKVVALSLSFLNVLKSYYFVLFSLRKMQNKIKKQVAFENLLPHISTTGAL
jgi:hypothetical protein